MQATLAIEKLPIAQKDFDALVRGILRCFCFVISYCVMAAVRRKCARL